MLKAFDQRTVAVKQKSLGRVQREELSTNHIHKGKRDADTLVAYTLGTKSSRTGKAK